MSIVSNTKAYRDISADVEGNTLSHAYIIFSSDTEAVHQLFLMLAQKISCPSGGCGECNTCGLILKGAHPDVKFYSGADKIKVEDINAMIDSTYLMGAMQDAKLYFIERAELLSASVQNKLLKTFEEPPKNVTIFLSAGSDGALLPTIKSRAKKMYIPPFRSYELIGELVEEGADEESAAIVASSAAGSYTRAIALIGDEKYQALYEKVFEMLRNLKKTDGIIDYISDEMWSKDNLNMTLDFFEVVLRDILLLVTGASNELISSTRKIELREMSEGWTATGLAMAIKRVNVAREKASLNLTGAGVAEILLFETLEAKYKWRL